MNRGDVMLLVECIDASNLSVLTEGKRYYAFPVNSSHAYISNFPNENAHSGCYSLHRFREVPQEVEQKEPYVYHYKIFATKKTVVVYGFEVTSQLIAIYKDPALKHLIGCVSKEKCTVHQKLEPVTSWAAYVVFPSVLLLGDLEGLQEVVDNGVAEKEVTECKFEQLCLF